MQKLGPHWQSILSPTSRRRNTRSKGVLRQRDVFATQVQPRLAEGKTAYVWVDALRFEMAREHLQHALGRL